MKYDELKDRWFWAYPTESVDCDGITRIAHEVYGKSEVDAAIAELKQKLEDVNEFIKTARQMLEDAKATAYADSVNAGMRERRLRRALWVTRTAMAKSEKDRWNAHVDCGNRRNRKDPAFIKTGKLLEVSEWRKLWADIERKCFKKVEEYR